MQEKTELTYIVEITAMVAYGKRMIDWKKHMENLQGDVNTESPDQGGSYTGSYTSYSEIIKKSCLFILWKSSFQG